MANSLRFMVTILGFAAGCVLAGAPAGAGAEQSDTAWASSELDELLQWHSGLSVESNMCIAPQRESVFSALPQSETAPLLAWHGAPGAAEAAGSSVFNSAK